MVRICFDTKINFNQSLTPKYKVEYLSNNGLDKMPSTEYEEITSRQDIDLGCTYTFVANTQFIKTGTSQRYQLQDFVLNSANLKVDLAYKLPEYHTTKYNSFAINYKELNPQIARVLKSNYSNIIIKSVLEGLCTIIL